jgi:hypothetical protein
MFQLETRLEEPWKLILDDQNIQKSSISIYLAAARLEFSPTNRRLRLIWSAYTSINISPDQAQGKIEFSHRKRK